MTWPASTQQLQPYGVIQKSQIASGKGGGWIRTNGILVLRTNALDHLATPPNYHQVLVQLTPVLGLCCFIR
jgi:hypothetical protein